MRIVTGFHFHLRRGLDHHGGVPEPRTSSTAVVVEPKREVVEPEPRTSSTAVSTGGEGDQTSENQDEDKELGDEDDPFGSDDEDGSASEEDAPEEHGTGGSCFGGGVGDALTSNPPGSPTCGRSWWANGSRELP